MRGKYSQDARVIFKNHNDEKLKKKGMQHKDFPGGHPYYYDSHPSTLNFGVLIGSGALVLV